MRINGFEWTVRLVAPSHPMLLTPWHTHAFGACDKRTTTIYIDKTLPKDFIKDVLCHELTHAVMFSYNITLPYEVEEIVAELFTEYGEQILSLTHFIYNGIKMK